MRFYVCTKSAWASDTWTPVAGPWSSRAAAEDAALDYARPKAPRTLMRYACVMSRTALARRGWPRTERGEYELLEAMHDNYEHVVEWPRSITTSA